MEPVGPLALTLGQETDLPPARDGKAAAVILNNASPFSCAVAINGPQKWLAPWTSDLYQYPAGATVRVTPQLELSGGSTDNVLTATYVDPNDVVQASYPQTLTSQAIAAAISGAVAISGSVPVTNTTTSGNPSSLRTVATGTPTANVLATPVLSTSNPSTPFSAKVYPGALGVVLVTVKYGPGQTYPATFSLAVNGTGWLADKTTVTFQAAAGGGAYSYATFLCWKCPLDGSDVATTFSISGGVNPVVSTLAFAIGSGGNDEFSNPTLTGLQLGTITYGSYSATSPLALPATTPGLIIAASALNVSSVSVSVGTIYSNSGTGTGSVFLATSQTGQVNIQTSASLDTSIAAANDACLVIPQ